MYSSKTKSIDVFSSTEADIIAAVNAAKTAQFLISMLREIGFP